MIDSVKLIMMKQTILQMTFCLVFVAFVSTDAAATITLLGDCQSPQVHFAANDLDQVCAEVRPVVDTLTVTFSQDSTLGKQAYRIVVDTPTQLTVAGGDPIGLMYGGLRLAECIRLGRGIERVRAESGSPYLAYRGLKMNFPLDARTPSYDDTGDSARWNIETMWDFSFWQDYLDDMARHRYNALTLWSRHPFPSLIKLEAYPDVALDDVCTRAKQTLKHQRPGHFTPEELPDLVVIKTMTIDEKIDFWRRVMAYARDRGIDILIITWNVHLDGAYGQYGIGDEPDNAATIAYMRASIGTLLKTYPDLAGLGVTAGEHMTQFANPEAKEQWLWQTYGLGVKDALADNPKRQVRFIHRHWQTGLKPVLETFAEFPGTLDTSYKYAKARIYSKPDPVFADEMIEECRQINMKSWWNLRNDDLYCLRWGDPSYVRAMIKNMPREQTAGFHMGSDGYVWARNFALRDPRQRGELEIRRHWYNFMLWGRLGYDPSLDRRFFETVLQARYPEVDAAVLYTTWATSSQIMPQINRFFFKRGDWMFAPEGCQWAPKGFLTVDDFIAADPMKGCKEISIRAFLKLSGPVDPGKVCTPLNVAENLDAYVDESLCGVQRLRKKSVALSVELSSLLTDIESMAWLGRYYADKIRGATHVAQFRNSGDPSRKQEAVSALEKASRSWQRYAQLCSSQYRPQVLARTRTLDWQALAKDVEKEVETVRSEVSRK